MRTFNRKTDLIYLLDTSAVYSAYLRQGPTVPFDSFKPNQGLICRSCRSRNLPDWDRHLFDRIWHFHLSLLWWKLLFPLVNK